MKQTENNEMDLVLRNLARREGSRSLLGESAIEDHLSHLNADELNAYAERALPAAARARYTRHLADCASCRKIVSELTASAGVSVGESRVDREASISVWQKISAFFSPAVLRYAIPAVLLFAVGGVTFIALRQQRQADFVAENRPAATRLSEAEDKQVETPSAKVSSESSALKKLADENQPATGLYTAKDSKEKEQAETAKTVRSDDSPPAAAEKDAGAAKNAGAVAAQPSYAPEPAPAPPAKPGPAIAEAKTKEEETRKDQPATRDSVARRQEDERTRSNAADREAQTTGVASAGGRTNVQGLHRVESKRPADSAGKKSDDDAEIRSVSGRRFRRQGSLWVDVSYQASAATTMVARGSDQYRALVADEPGIRTIADQLQGEVIVVWKGRAYRIR